MHQFGTTWSPESQESRNRSSSLYWEPELNWLLEKTSSSSSGTRCTSASCWNPLLSLPGLSLRPWLPAGDHSSPPRGSSLTYICNGVPVVETWFWESSLDGTTWLLEIPLSITQSSISSWESSCSFFSFSISKNDSSLKDTVWKSSSLSPSESVSRQASLPGLGDLWGQLPKEVHLAELSPRHRAHMFPLVPRTMLDLRFWKSYMRSPCPSSTSGSPLNGMMEGVPISQPTGICKRK